MTIDNYKVYDLAESIVASGFPMKAEYNYGHFEQSAKMLYAKCAEGLQELHNGYIRACKLANNPTGSGHCNFLSGILVSANVTATIKWWHQLERYHFVQIVSSMSTMHRLRQMVQQNKLNFHPKTYVYRCSLAEIECNEDDEQLAYSCPMGLELTARITTNYLQLKTIYAQRKNHKLTEWRDFCEWITELPFAKEFITGADDEA